MKKSSMMVADAIVSILAVVAALLFPWSFWSLILLVFFGFFFSGFIKDVYDLGKEKNEGYLVTEDNLPRDIYEVVSELKFSNGRIAILRNKMGVLIACISRGDSFMCFSIRNGAFIPIDLTPIQVS